MIHIKCGSMYYKREITGKNSPAHNFVITCVILLLVYIGDIYLWLIFERLAQIITYNDIKYVPVNSK